MAYKDPEIQKAYDAQYYKKNREKRLQKKKEYRQTTKGREVDRKASLNYRARNLDRIRKYDNERHANDRETKGYEEDLFNELNNNPDLGITDNREIGYGMPDVDIHDFKNNTDYYAELKWSPTLNLHKSTLQDNQKAKFKELLNQGENVKIIVGNKLNYRFIEGEELLELL